MYKRVKFKRGLHLFKGLCLLFLPNVPGAMFIQGGTFIPDSRVKLVLLKAHKRSRQAFNSLKSKKAFWQGQGFSVERMVNSEFVGREF